MIATQIKPPSAETKETTRPRGRPGEAVKFTVDEAIALMHLGIVPEDSTVELLNGVLEYVDRRDSDSAEAGAAPFGPVLFTVDDVLAMVEAGILPEDTSIELLRGTLEYRDTRDSEDDMGEGKKHRLVVALLGKLGAKLDTDARHLSTQSTIVCGDKYMPVPDAAVFHGVPRDYVDRFPSPEDVYALIEVSVTSYAKDVRSKLSDYARVGIRQYVILNLNNRTAEVYTDPNVADGTYATKITVAADGVLALRVGEAETFDVPLAELLP